MVLRKKQPRGLRDEVMDGLVSALADLGGASEPAPGPRRKRHRARRALAGAALSTAAVRLAQRNRRSGPTARDVPRRVRTRV